MISIVGKSTKRYVEKEYGFDDYLVNKMYDGSRLSIFSLIE